MEVLTFFPAQPEIQYKMDNYIEKKPLGNSFISKNIALFYQFKTQKNHINSFTLIPDGCFDMLFCCSPKKTSGYLLTSPLKREEPIELRSDCEYFGVRFFPEQSIFNLKYSMRELLGKKIPLENVIPVDNFFEEELLIDKSFDKRIGYFEKFIGNLTSEFSYNNIVEFFIKQIYLSKGSVDIKQLSMDSGYSSRYIRKLFEKSIGFSPKQFSEVVRFQKSLAMIFHENHYSSLDIVHENGYYDQAHFIKRFKKFADVTPNQFAKYLCDV